MRTQIALYISKNTVHTYTALYIHYVYNTALAFMAPYKNTYFVAQKIQATDVLKLWELCKLTGKYNHMHEFHKAKYRVF